MERKHNKGNNELILEWNTNFKLKILIAVFKLVIRPFSCLRKINNNKSILMVSNKKH